MNGSKASVEVRIRDVRRDIEYRQRIDFDLAAGADDTEAAAVMDEAYARARTTLLRVRARREGGGR